MVAASKESSPRREGNSVVLPVALLVLPLLYALSTGPASYLQSIGVIDVATLAYVYYPLDKVEEFCPPFSYGMELYRERCISLASRLLPEPENQPPPRDPVI